MVTEEPLAHVGCDAVALKPSECDISRATGFSVDTIAIDYEGREHLPSAETLRRLTEHATVYLTTPIRADGFDPLGDNSLVEWIPDGIGRVFVAGNPAYLSERERCRSVSPRLGKALDRLSTSTSPLPPWVGTEGIERLALAAGGVQYDLLSPSTLGTVRGFRSVGYGGEIAIYAPTVLSDDDNVILDALGGYIARRQAVRRVLDDTGDTVSEDGTGETTSPDRHASGRTRDILLTAAEDFALVGDSETIRERITALHDAGVDTVVTYPATGIEAVE